MIIYILSSKSNILMLLQNVFMKDKMLLLHWLKSLCQSKLSVLPLPHTLRTSRPATIVIIIITIIVIIIIIISTSSSSPTSSSPSSPSWWWWWWYSHRSTAITPANNSNKIVLICSTVLHCERTTTVTLRSKSLNEHDHLPELVGA